MRRKPEILAANPVRKKREFWQQIKITSFAKKKGAILTLKAEECCDSYHQDLRRDKTPYRKHPKRVLRSFIYYTLYVCHIPYSDEEGAGILLHDVPEEIGLSTLINIRQRYGKLIPIYVKIFTRLKQESVDCYFKRISQTDFAIMFKVCDMIDGFLGMLDEYYAGLDSSSIERIKAYLEEKAIPFIFVVKSKNLTGLKYKKPIEEALMDFEFIRQEALELLAINSCVV
ncbi:MAG: hypothetical protein M0P97_00040 [Candidatus Moranbacteria bacterium]|nr:hypothetical protein [Candidatus Moranbacteria bacterium]